MENKYIFKEKDCPFCYSGECGDDRSRIGLDKCNHTFSHIEYIACMQSIKDLEKTIKENKLIARKMKKIIEATLISS